MKPPMAMEDGGRVHIKRRGLDEVIVELFTNGGDTIHLERMGPNEWCLIIGDANLCVQTLKGGKTRVTAVDGVE